MTIGSDPRVYLWTGCGGRMFVSFSGAFNLRRVQRQSRLRRSRSTSGALYASGGFTAAPADRGVCAAEWRAIRRRPTQIQWL